MSDLKNILLPSVFPNPGQPRKEFDQAKLEELAQSILTYGVQEPIKVTPRPFVGEGQGVRAGFMIVMGERRYRASVLAGVEKIPAIVEDFTDEQVEELALLENLQREDLNIIEEANAYQRLLSRMDIETLIIFTFLHFFIKTP